MKFREFGGGAIIDVHGREVVKIAVDVLTTDEARRVAGAIIAALDAEFAADSQRDVTSPDGAVDRLLTILARWDREGLPFVR